MHLNDLSIITTLLFYPQIKGHVTVVLDKADYNNKMDTLVNDKHTYELLKPDPNAITLTQTQQQNFL